jgi:hypothetical protein
VRIKWIEIVCFVLFCFVLFVLFVLLVLPAGDHTNKIVQRVASKRAISGTDTEAHIFLRHKA